MTIRQFIRDDYPFRPGAAYSGDSFGLRNQDRIGSIYHPGQDRSGKPSHIIMPFDGRIDWSITGSQWGSLLRIIPAGFPDAEIQVAHTLRYDGSRASHRGSYKQGDELPVYASDIGLTDGSHTHTELIIKNTAKNYAYFRTDGGLVYDGEKIRDHAWIKAHCFAHKMDYQTVFQRLLMQISAWGISEIWHSFCVRDILPEYRNPQWGEGSVIIADTRRYLDL